MPKILAGIVSGNVRSKASTPRCEESDYDESCQPGTLGDAAVPEKRDKHRHHKYGITDVGLPDIATARAKAEPRTSSGGSN